MISASNMLPPSEFYHAETGAQPTTVLVLPAFILVDLVTPYDAPELIHRFVDAGPTTTTPLTSPAMERNGDGGGYDGLQSHSGISSALETEQVEQTEEPPDVETLNDTLPALLLSERKLSCRPCAHAYLILLCSQKTRDARCGQSAPLLRRELERQLRPLGLYRDLDDERPGGVGIYFISHVGGHKYSANIMIYRKEEGQAIWLARVRPEHIEGIVKHTVLQGKVVHPDRQLRGGFDRRRGLISW
jgi:(2Fe-2S) ferredoxin